MHNKLRYSISAAVALLATPAKSHEYVNFWSTAEDREAWLASLNERSAQEVIAIFDTIGNLQGLSCDIPMEQIE